MNTEEAPNLTARPVEAVTENRSVIKTENLPPEPIDDGSEVPDVDILPVDDDKTLAHAHGRTRKLPKWQEQFIEAFVAALRKKPIVGLAIDEACAKAGRGISSKTAYRWREEDEEFRDAWNEALERGWDNAEAEAFRRAVEGTVVPIVSRKSGEIVGHTTEYSDRLLELLLKGNRAEKYREKTGPLVNINLGKQEDALTAAIENGVLKEFFDRKLTVKGDSP